MGVYNKFIQDSRKVQGNNPVKMLQVCNEMLAAANIAGINTGYIGKIQKISDNNSKIFPMVSINLLASVTCDDCLECKAKFCYACKGNFQFDNTIAARLSNTLYYLQDPACYEAAIIADLESRKAHHMLFGVRINDSGDLIDVDYLAMIDRVARRFPECEFHVFTKRYEYVNAWIAAGNKLSENVYMLYSFDNWKQLVNPYNFPVARVLVEKDYCAAAGEYICTGRCNDCRAEHKGCFDRSVNLVLLPIH